MTVPAASQRSLILVPIVHSPAEAGSLSDSVRQAHVRRAGAAGWEQHVSDIEDLWRAIAHAIDRLPLDPRDLNLYQDGLPQCEAEGEIVRALAREGSANHRLLLELMDRGATLFGTESPALLLEEYHLARQLLGNADQPGLDAANQQALRDHQQRAADLLARRDRFIAGRIEETLGTGKVGLVFLGALHDLTQYLSVDIATTRLALSNDREGAASTSFGPVS